MTTQASLKSFCLRTALLILPILVFLKGWGSGAHFAIQTLLNGSAPEHTVWSNSWSDLMSRTVDSILILLLCAIGFAIYGKFKERTFAETTQDIGLTLFSKSSVKMFVFAFSGWYISLAVGSWVAWALTEYFPMYDVTTASVPQQNVIPFFLSSIQAGPTEEIALVPLFLLLIPAAFPARYRNWSLGFAIILAFVARVSFHLYYGPTAFVKHSLWAAGIILVWLITRNVLGLILAHSFSNGLIALAIDPSYSWAIGLNFLLLLVSLFVLIAVFLNKFWPHLISTLLGVDDSPKDQK